MTGRVDFTAHRAPLLAIACPGCGAPVDMECRRKRPSGHPAPGSCQERKDEADRIHEAQGGGWIVQTPTGGWELYPLDGLPPHIASKEQPKRRRSCEPVMRLRPPAQGVLI